MVATRRGRCGRRFATTVHKPHGIIQLRVLRVGPVHFGIVRVDCLRIWTSPFSGSYRQTMHLCFPRFRARMVLVAVAVEVTVIMTSSGGVVDCGLCGNAQVSATVRRILYAAWTAW